MRDRRVFAGRLAALLLLAGAPAAQDDVADVKSEDVRIGGDAQRRYFRIGPGKEAPAKGYGLLVILPGGDGGDGFHAFCKRIYKHACDDTFVAAQPVAVKWTEQQQIVWPTRRNPVPEMKFATEDFVEAVIEDAGKWVKIDPARVYLLGWSSSGPALYAISLSERRSPTGYFVAMSVFKPHELPDLGRAKGQAYFLYHSPDDRVCPFAMAQDAEKQLKKRGARVKFLEYRGGHGWTGPVYADIKTGLSWLEENHSKPAKKSG